jgi:hypothetical protein
MMCYSREKVDRGFWNSDRLVRGKLLDERYLLSLRLLVRFTDRLGDSLLTMSRTHQPTVFLFEDESALAAVVVFVRRPVSRTALVAHNSLP